MVSAAIPYLTDSEGEVIRLLVEVGLKAHEARLLVVFFRGIQPTSRELERITDLRQPEVSIAVSNLSKRGWVYVSDLNTASKGRPIKIFALTKSIDNILDDIKEGISAGHGQQVLMLQRIRDIIRN